MLKSTLLHAPKTADAFSNQLESERDAAAAPAASAPAAPLAPSREPDSPVLKPNLCSISPQTIFKGNIETKDLVVVDGTLQGNLTTESQATVVGRVEGDVHAQSVQLRGGHIKGNLSATNNVLVAADSCVDGNIQAQSILLSAGSRVTGDLSAKEISMEKGALVLGHLEVTQPGTKPPSSSAPARA